MSPTDYEFIRMYTSDIFRAINDKCISPPLQKFKPRAWAGVPLRRQRNCARVWRPLHLERGLSAPLCFGRFKNPESFPFCFFSPSRATFPLQRNPGAGRCPPSAAAGSRSQSPPPPRGEQKARAQEARGGQAPQREPLAEGVGSGEPAQPRCGELGARDWLAGQARRRGS